MKRVLIVDDEDAFARMLAEFLRGKGLEAEVCYSGHMVVRKLFEKKFDLVVLDVWMVEMGGVQVYKKIRKADSKLPVLMMSGYASSELKQMLRALNVEHFISKPFALSDFWKVAQKLLEGSAGDRKADAEEDGAAQAATGDEAARPRPPAPEDIYRVLVADDDPAYLEVLATMFAEKGYQVFKAGDGAQALELFRAHPEINTIVLDVEMPRKSGIEVLRAVRAERPQTLVLIITALQDEAVHRQLMDMEGAYAVFEKPFSFRHFLRFVETSEQIRRFHQPQE